MNNLDEFQLVFNNGRLGLQDLLNLRRTCKMFRLFISKITIGDHCMASVKSIKDIKKVPSYLYNNISIELKKAKKFDNLYMVRKLHIINSDDLNLPPFTRLRYLTISHCSSEIVFPNIPELVSLRIHGYEYEGDSTMPLGNYPKLKCLYVTNSCVVKYDLTKYTLLEYYRTNHEITKEINGLKYLKYVSSINYPIKLIDLPSLIYVEGTTIECPNISHLIGNYKDDLYMYKNYIRWGNNNITTFETPPLITSKVIILDKLRNEITMPNVEYLKLVRFPYSTLHSYEYLQELIIKSSYITKINNLPKLRKLSISRTKITKIENLPLLDSLYLEICDDIDINDCKSVTKLYIIECKNVAFNELPNINELFINKYNLKKAFITTNINKLILRSCCNIGSVFTNIPNLTSLSLIKCKPCIELNITDKLKEINIKDSEITYKSKLSLRVGINIPEHDFTTTIDTHDFDYIAENYYYVNPIDYRCP